MSKYGFRKTVMSKFKKCNIHRPQPTSGPDRQGKELGYVNKINKLNRHKAVSKCSLSFYNLLEIANVRSDMVPNHRLKVRTYPSIREENRAVVNNHYLNRPSKPSKKPGISYRKTSWNIWVIPIKFYHS